MLLEIAADANNVDEMINSPEINPNSPVINISPVKISFLKSLISKNPWLNSDEGVFYLKYEITIVDVMMVNNGCN